MDFLRHQTELGTIIWRLLDEGLPGRALTQIANQDESDSGPGQGYILPISPAFDISP